jgi:hypothetical protein
MHTEQFTLMRLSRTGFTWTDTRGYESSFEFKFPGTKFSFAVLGTVASLIMPSVRDSDSKYFFRGLRMSSWTINSSSKAEATASKVRSS